MSDNPVGSDPQQEPVFISPTDTEAAEVMHNMPLHANSDGEAPTHRNNAPANGAVGNPEGGDSPARGNEDGIRAPEGEGTSPSNETATTTRPEPAPD